MSSAGGASRNGTRRKPLPSAGCARALSSKLPRRKPLLTQQVEVDVGCRDLTGPGEPLSLGQQRGVFVDRGLTVPGEVGRRFARSRGRVDIGRKTASRGRLAVQVAAAGTADRDGTAAEVGEDGRARRAPRPWLGEPAPHMSSQISMPSRNPGTSSAAKIRSVPNGACVAPIGMVSPRNPAPGAKCRFS